MSCTAVTYGDVSSGTFKSAVARLFGSQTGASDAAESDLRPQVNVAEGWLLPRALQDFAETGDLYAPASVTTLGPLGGPQELTIDSAGWIAVGGASWSLDWAVRDGDGWQRPSEAAGVTQKVIEPAVIETSLPSGGGAIVQRVAVAVVAGQPSAVIEIENRSPVAVAVAAAVRPFNRTGAGINVIRSVAHGVTVEGVSAITAETAPRSVHLDATDDTLRLLLEHGDVPEVSGKPGPVTSASNTANATLVWPLPHTATLRLSMPLTAVPVAGAVVPTPADVNRGWQRHLESSMLIQVDDADLGPATLAAQRDVLSRLPDREAASAWMAAVAEAGFAADASRALGRLDPRFDPGGTVFAIGRTIELGDVASFGRAEALADASDEAIEAGFEPPSTWAEEALEPLAIAAHELHRIAKRGGSSAADRVPPLLTAGTARAAADVLRSIDQPDVAERVEQIVGLPLAAPADAWEGIQRLRSDASPTWAWSKSHGRLHDVAGSAAWLLDVRRLVLVDDHAELRLLPNIPVAWRGRDVSVYRLPIAGASLSYGLRWHGPRPALLWEITPDDDAAARTGPWRITVPGISPSWSTTESAGEELLPDPAWG